MDFQRKSSFLIASVVLILSGIQGQLDDFMKICDLCNVFGLKDCNSTNIFHINMTVNCEMTNKMCTLGINEFFEGFENLTIHDIDMKHICIFKEMSKDPSNNNSSAESLEHFETTSEPFYDMQSNEVTFFKTTLGDELIELSPIQKVSTETYENQYSENNQQDEDKDSSSIAAKTTMTIITSTGIFENLTLVTDEPNLDESFDIQHDEPIDLVRSLNESLGNTLEKSVQAPIPLVETVPCFACESSKTDACLGRIDELKTIGCPKQSGCISYYSNGTLVRNCGSVVSPQEAELCHKPNNFTCDSCPLAECNKKLWKECFKCNSKDDPNCALWSNAETVPLAVCPNYNDNCLVRITKDGDTLRECSAPDVKCTEEELCSICEGPLCNSGVYPPNRLQCIQCEECEEAQDPNTALPCLHYNVTEKCFLYVTAKSRMIRGCVSNVSGMQECQNNEPKCITCDEKNGCNSVPLMKEPTLSCIKCKSKDSPSCVWQQSETSVSKCVNKFLYYLTETCLTQFDASSEDVVRDCSFDYGVCTPEDQDCKSCLGNGCNSDGLKVQQCIQCQSDRPGQIECANQAVGIPPTKCPHQEKPTFENRGCVTITKGNITYRGCVAGLSTEDLNLCKKKDQTSCEICMDELCKKVLAPSASSRRFQISLITLLSVSVFLTIA